MMTGETSGEVSSSDWISRTRVRLDEWELNVGLPAFGVPRNKEDAIYFLELLRSEREKLTPDECADAAIVLAQYAAYLTRLQQREESEASLLEDRITQAIADRLGKQTAYSYQEKRILAVRENEVARSLDRQRMGAAAKAKRLAYFSNRVDAVSRAYQYLANARKRERQYGE